MKIRFGVVLNALEPIIELDMHTVILLICEIGSQIDMFKGMAKIIWAQAVLR